MPLIIDGHLDLAMNALLNERDQTLTVQQIREREADMTDDDPGIATNSLSQMRHAGVALCIATVIARTRPVKPGRKRPRVHGDLDYPTQEMAYAAAQGQLAYYRMLESQGHLRTIRDRTALDAHWACWQARGSGDKQLPVGVIITMEGADPIVEPAQVHEWCEQGVRTLMLAHFSHSSYAMGTLPPDGSERDGPITQRGRELLREMEKLPMALDLTHLCDQSFFEALDRFPGPVLASHSNCRALADSPRQISDEQIKRIIDRGGVIGLAMHYAMLRHDSGNTLKPEDIGLDAVADHVDHVCQLAGGSQHVAIGSDLDGGFGADKCPYDLDTIADLHKLEPILTARGYSTDDVASIFHGNWLRFFRQTLPEG